MVTRSPWTMPAWVLPSGVLNVTSFIYRFPYKRATIKAAHTITYLQVPTQLLFVFQCLEKGLEVAFTKAMGALAFDDLKEDRWAIDHGFGEDLQEIALLVVIDEDAELGQVFDILGNVAHAIQYVFIVVAGSLQEFDAAILQIMHRGDDIAGSEGDMLHAGAIIEFQVFFDLRFFAPRCWFVNWQFDTTAAVLHDLGHEGRIFRADGAVVEVY